MSAAAAALSTVGGTADPRLLTAVTATRPGRAAVLRQAAPGMSRETLAKLVVAEIVPLFDCPASFFQTLYALICHAGWHSDRAWTSMKRLAGFASDGLKKTGGKGFCSRTAQRAMRFWEDRLGIRVIRDQEELLSGPGEHDWVDRGNAKKGHGQTNHYDVSALRRWVNPEVAAALEALADGGQIVEAEPSEEPEAPRDVDAQYTDPFTPDVNPFAEEAEPAPPAPSPPSSSVSRTSHPPVPVSAAPPVCHVRHTNTETDAVEAPRSASGPSGIDVPNLSAIRTGSAAPASEARGRAATVPLAMQASPPKPVAGAAELMRTEAYTLLTRARKFDAGGALKLLRDHGEAKVRTVIEYTRWMEERTGDTYGPGWITNTLNAWDGGPEAFERHQERERARKREDRHAAEAGHNAAARTVLAAPQDTPAGRRAATPAPPRSGPAAETAAFDALDPADRDVLLAAARDRLLATAHPAVRGLVQKSGVASPLVQNEAKRMLAGGWPGGETVHRGDGHRPGAQ